MLKEYSSHVGEDYQLINIGLQLHEPKKIDQIIYHFKDS